MCFTHFKLIESNPKSIYSSHSELLFFITIQYTINKSTKDKEDKMLSQNVLLENNFYLRLLRSMDAWVDDRVELDKLLDPAPECDKSSWSRDAFKLNKINKHPHNPQADDSEDI